MQWPCPTRITRDDVPARGPPVAPVRQGQVPSGRVPAADRGADSEYPFVLSTGRTLYHYNSATMTMREDGITDKQVEPFFEIAPEDASALGVAEGEWVRLVSRRGDLTARASSPTASIPASSGWRSISPRRA